MQAKLVNLFDRERQPLNRYNIVGALFERPSVAAFVYLQLNPGTVAKAVAAHLARQWLNRDLKIDLGHSGKSLG